MTLHRSLSRKSQGQHRNVLKRYEKIKILKEKDKWDEENPIYYGLPKVKSIKLKIKKVKAEKPAEAAAAGTAAPEAKAASTEPAKGK